MQRRPASFLRINVATLYTSIRKGDVPHRKLGSRVLRLSKAALVSWLAAKEAGPSPGP